MSTFVQSQLCFAIFSLSVDPYCRGLNLQDHAIGVRQGNILDRWGVTQSMGLYKKEGTLSYEGNQ